MHSKNKEVPFINETRCVWFQMINVRGNSHRKGTTLKPIGSMYGIYPYIYHKNQPNVGKYTIHGSSGKDFKRTFHLPVSRDLMKGGNMASPREKRKHSERWKLHSG